MSGIEQRKEGSKNQSRPSAWPNHDGDSGSKGIGGGARAVRIFADCNHANSALAKWRTVFEGSGDVVHFPDRFGRVGDFLNQEEILLIGDVLDLEMVDAVGGLCCRAGWLRGVIIGPSRGYICGENFGVEKSPGNEDCSCCDKQRSGRSPLDARAHTSYWTPPDLGLRAVTQPASDDLF